MSESKNKRHDFHYSAHGHGFSAQFEQPHEHVLDVQAGTSLPIIGGHGSSRVENFRYKEIVSFKAAYTHVSGSRDKETGSHGTLVTSTVEHLNVLDVVTADRVVSRLASHYLPGEEEPHIIPLGSRFENLRIAGCPVDVEMDCELFTEFDTYGAFKKQFEKDKKFREMTEERFLWGKLEKDVPESVRARYNWAGQKSLPESHGVILCSLVKNIRTSCPGVKRYGNVLFVPQFGRVFLAEYLIEHSHRGLTMVRLELGCAVSGHAAITEARINGRPWP
jgi:hypothetical protein